MSKKKSHYRKKSYYPMGKPSPTMVLTQSELNKIKNNIKEETVDKISTYDVEIMLTCFAWVLRKDYGWGYKRIFRALKSIDKVFGQVLDGELSDEDMRNQLKDETSVVIKCDGGENGD